MIASIIVAVITGGFSVLTVYLTIKNENNKSRTELLTRFALQEQKVDVLSERVDKHNTLVERTYELEKKVAVLEAKNDFD